MLRIIASSALLALSSLNAHAEEKSEGRVLAEMSFRAADEAGKGYLTLGDLESQGSNVFISMDSDEDDRLSEDEFISWGFGLQNIAEEENKGLAYRTALRVVFNFWDLNGDGGISRREMRKAQYADFERSDRDDDGVLTQDEFLSGHSVLLAIRAALKPEVR